ncbi:zf-DHHC domain-containing protein isoform X1 [Hemibagrus wyckioides]|uniref:zf-DHHC domain-containing protein isoform X1 n=1 Tax=Hemibagrus wyckioides TaxID=337641 RepID=UPI00266BD5AC|nr:zf-DHHC domain-containing protein isoform X1 [Hemibagrus wyckioides]
MAVLRCRRDPCGLICIILTYFSVFYADYVVIQYVLIPAYSGSVWCTLHGSVFNVILLLLLACHSKAVFSDPGMVPLPETAIDFSDLRSQSSRVNDRVRSHFTVHCVQLHAVPAASAISEKRLVKAGLCVAAVKPIVLLVHITAECVSAASDAWITTARGMASLYSMALVVSAWVWRIRNELDGDEDKGGEDVPSKHLIVAHYIILLVESILFGVFVLVIFYDQLVSIITDETPIEQMRNRLMKDRPNSGQSVHTTHTRKPKVALLREVFGRGSVLCWLLPFQSSPPSAGGITYSPVSDYDV